MLRELVIKNRTYRGYDESASIDRSTLLELIDLTRYTASTAILKDVGIVAQTITLGAAEKGLGCCMMGSFDLPKLRALLHLAENLEPKLVIALGKPAEKIVLTEVQNGSTTYYRDEDGVHYVPKRSLEDILI